MGAPSKLPLPTGSAGTATELPGSQPQPPPPPVPAFWQEPSRIIADVLELYGRKPEEARQVWEFARKKLAELRN